MRNNQPIIDKEYLVVEGLTLVSKTDLNGTILECNDAFETASGYSRAELIGQPHNMIRHPDVPAAVFADMWADLKNGIPWTQIVKNRRKDGGFYWVKAQATPIYKDGKMTGYMSIRSHISDTEKKAANQAYQALNNGQLNIRHGQFYTGINFNKLNTLARLNPTTQLALMVGLLSFIPSIVWWFEPTIMPTWLMASFSAALLLSMILYGVKLAKNQALTIKALRKLAGGQALAEHRYNPESYSGQLSNATIATNLAFLENREESAYQLDQASQLKMAMDKLKSNVMIVDQNYNIMYLNTSMEAFLVNREARLKELLPHFNARQLMGKNIDLFHTHPAHQREIIGKLEQPVAATIVVAGYHLELTMLPIKNRVGVRTATLVEWNDRTQEVQLLQNVGATVKKAQQGYLGERIDVSQLEGVALELSDSINQLLGSIQGAMQDVIRVTSGMANGDLTNIIDNHFDGELGELKEAINSSISRLDGVISIAIQASVIVDGAAREVSQGSHDLSARVQEQAAALEKTSATMEEMSSTIQLNTENTREASKVAQGVQLKANEGAEVMGRTIEAMQAIQQSSHKIADIVSLIDGIAFQTNLLALNAAVEAARAGEHGRGFAVVASEVRALAQKSANAAKDIKHLINESVTRIDQGTQLAGQSGQVLTGITGSINDVSAMIEHIARATQEQAQGIHQVHDAITSIDQVTQQNAALVEETAAASESLSDQSKSLTREMSFFKTSSRAHTASAKLNKPMTKVLPPKAQPGLVTKEPVKRMSKNLPTNINDEWSDF